MADYHKALVAEILQFAQKYGQKEFKTWVAKAYTTFDLAKTAEKIKLTKKNIWFKDTAFLWKFLSQFPQVNETFISENLHLLESAEGPTEQKEEPIPKKPVKKSKTSKESKRKSKQSKGKSKKPQVMNVEKEEKIEQKVSSLKEEEEVLEKQEMPWEQLT